MTLLSVEGLHVSLPLHGELVPIVEDVNLSLESGQVLGIAGESGSGKTMSAMAVMGLLPPGAVVSGAIHYRGKNLLELGERSMRKIRGEEIAMVFQDPLSSLHPMLTVGRQLTDHLRSHRRVGRKAAEARALELLEMVRIPNPAAAVRAYPHQLSGGMRQRVAIAIALACEPAVLIADEPTTALDVTVQAGIIELLLGLTETAGIGIMIVTHDLGVLSSVADRLAVFYAGRVVESGRAADIFQRPCHPYTEKILQAIPHGAPSDAEQLVLTPMGGAPPAAGEWPDGCSFHPRCDLAVSDCSSTVPLLGRRDAQLVACHVRGVNS